MDFRSSLFVFLFIMLITGTISAQEISSDFTRSLHPRIMLLKGEEQQIKDNIARNPIWSKMHQAILVECDKMIDMPPVERIQIGKRLLDKSRECLRRVFYLSYAYRLTGEEKYFQRAEKEMLAVSRFSNWNPSHFLDVAEMTMGVAIGYDWLYDKLSDESRAVIREAILTKGLQPSLDQRTSGFLTATHNWNQVCNAGMTFGALAIAEDHPELAKQLVERAIESIKLPMEDYKPDGAYPEGYTYWGYGTTFNIMFLSSIETLFKKDFGLTQIPGFLKTGGFLQHMTGATNLCFNWGDCGLVDRLNPAMFWFADRTKDPSILFIEKKFLQKDDFSDLTSDRLLPSIMIWGKNINIDKIQAPKAKMWVGQGANPVSLMRTSWTDPNAIYLGFKAGAASVNHAHMDIGSFVMESDGVRWAIDLVRQEYNSLETRGMQLFGRTQDAERWSIYRLNNFIHNTITVDNQLQLVKGYAKIDKYSDNPKFTYSISDISSVYEDQLAALTRGVAIVDQSYVLVRDELKTTNKASVIRWNMLTGADVRITGKNTATLTQDGKKLFIRVESPANVQLQTWSSQPTTDYDEPNPGTIKIGFEVNVPANQAESLTVLLIPEKSLKKTNKKIQPLAMWGKILRSLLL
jgi:hypothetical protein